MSKFALTERGYLKIARKAQVLVRNMKTQPRQSRASFRKGERGYYVESYKGWGGGNLIKRKDLDLSAVNFLCCFVESSSFLDRVKSSNSEILSCSHHSISPFFKANFLVIFLSCLMASLGDNLSIFVLEKIFFRESSLCFKFSPTENLSFSPNEAGLRNNFSFVFHQRSLREAVLGLGCLSVPNAHFVSKFLLHWLSCFLPLDNALPLGNSTLLGCSTSTPARNSSLG